MALPPPTLLDAQHGIVSRRQLDALGINRFHIRNQIAARRWVSRTETVISTTTGPLSRTQHKWLGVLHAGAEAMLGGLTAAEQHGLRNWPRDDITVLVPEDLKFDPVEGIDFVRTRRDLTSMRDPAIQLPTCRIEPAVLLFGAYQPSRRTAQGAVAATIQQRLASAEGYQMWLQRMRPLRWAPMFRRLLLDLEGGSQSLAEIDIVRLCRRYRLARPSQQTKRRDAGGRIRYTDCEWRLSNGHVVVLEVDGGFHMDVEHWEDDLARQRRISTPGRTVVRCTAREIREEPELVARDLKALGVPVVSPSVRGSAR